MCRYDDQMIDLETKEIWLNLGDGGIKRNGGRP